MNFLLFSGRFSSAINKKTSDPDRPDVCISLVFCDVGYCADKEVHFPLRVKSGNTGTHASTLQRARAFMGKGRTVQAAAHRKAALIQILSDLFTIRPLKDKGQDTTLAA